MQTFAVEPESAGKSLVRVILNHYPRLGAGRVYQALRRKDIRINGRRQHADGPVAAGDEITLYIADEYLAGGGAAAADQPMAGAASQSGSHDGLAGEPKSYQILYSDAQILIVNKKAGVTVQAAPGGKEQGVPLIDQLRLDLQEPGLDLCHRLDRQTSGLLILARQPAALAAVRAWMQDGRLVKRYRCLVRGRPAQGTPVIGHDGCPMLELTAWLEKDAAHSDVYIHDRKKPADLPIVTRYRILRVYPGAGPEQEDVSELEVELVTGRTHQIRAHLAHIGHPLLGDGKYGRNSFNRSFRGRNGALTRQQLCAVSLAFLPASKGPLAYLAGRTFVIEPDLDWPVPGQEPPSVSFS